MIIPIRCLTCGKPVGHKWEEFNEQVAKGYSKQEVLDKLELDRYCCRSLFLTHVDLAKRIGRFKK